jgi:carbamoyl-phosphate synthase large subunit
MKSYKILVTGCGDDVAQSIGKILRNHPIAERVIGCDIHNEHAGHFIFHQSFLVERASSPRYGESIRALVAEQEIDIIIPCTEVEIDYFVRGGFQSFDRGVVVRPNSFAVEIGLDKYRTIKFLEENQLPFPVTVLLEEIQEPLLPCVIKARRGSGSKAVYTVKDIDTFNLVRRILTNGICQEYLESSEEEYTCSVFRSRAGGIRTICFRRKLAAGGYTNYGVVAKNKAIDSLLVRLADLLRLEGSINVQLRLKDEIPMIFEINARFSSTVLFRHLFGYSDVLWSIQDVLGLQIESYVEPECGGRFYKAFQEYIVK